MAGGKLWSEEDQQFLEKYAGFKTLKWIAAKLGRTEQACKDRLSNTGDSTMIIHGLMTPNEVAAEYGTTREHIYSLVRRGHLPAKRRQSKTPRMWIDPKDAARFPKELWRTNSLRQGARHHLASVTEKQVLEIKSVPAEVSHSQVAEYYGVSRSVVAGIRQGRTWKHLKTKEWWER